MIPQNDDSTLNPATDNSSQDPKKDQGLAKQISELEKELSAAVQKNEALEAQIAQNAEKELRLLADVQNMRRRLEEGRAALSFESAQKVLKELLLVLDNFELAFRNIPEELKAHQWNQGIFAIQKQIEEFLKKEGVEEIAALGIALDPHQHEAVMTDPEGEEGSVTKILAKGYTYLGKVLRPAQVAVGSKR